MSKYVNFVGKCVRIQRELLGITVKDVADALKLSPLAISDIEKGNTLPGIEILQSMEKELGMDCSACIEFLLNRKDRISKNVAKRPSPVQVCYNRNEKDSYFM